jgi:hypothetical protein
LPLMAAPLGARAGGHKRTRLRSTRVVAAVWPPCRVEGLPCRAWAGRRRSRTRLAESHVAAAAAASPARLQRQQQRSCAWPQRRRSRGSTPRRTTVRRPEPRGVSGVACGRGGDGAARGHGADAVARAEVVPRRRLRRAGAQAEAEQPHAEGRGATRVPVSRPWPWREARVEVAERHEGYSAEASGVLGGASRHACT